MIKNIAAVGAHFFNHKQLITWSKQPLILPFYHAVTDHVPAHLKHLGICRSVQQFTDDLDFFLKYYRPISLEELMDMKQKGTPIPNNCFHLTFDDGLKEFYEVAAPILLKKGIPATVFLNSGFIDNKALFYRLKASILAEKLGKQSVLKITYSERDQLDELAKEHGIDFSLYLKENEPYLTSSQIKELQQQGFTFGAHSIDHPLYKELSVKEQVNQTITSVNEIAEKLGLDYQAFSFPFTDDGVSSPFFEEIKNKVALTFGCAGLKNDSVAFNLQRIPMETSKTGKARIKSEYFYYWMKGLVGKNTVVRG